MSMSDRKKVIIRYESIDAYNAAREDVHKIVKDDTDGAQILSTRMLPPSDRPTAALSEDAIKKLGELSGVIVQNQED
ncbi:uncharacterized protein L3040_009285 [Drepanopeziza brunnea f. sp. 'multigermtubi']|uniref:uncharacterized protein n=1 Tax=Drepanopeziza brunnea f. sp. 'multigermtubi' TaxID=698441 RepID=UPI00239EF7E7|nr:hypothetical protein L3040_009285 [Drepanopeziza brunnea f. sp. 'multigermtubi']